MDNHQRRLKEIAARSTRHTHETSIDRNYSKLAKQKKEIHKYVDAGKSLIA